MAIAAKKAVFFENVLNEKLKELDKWTSDCTEQEMQAERFLEEVQEDLFDKFKEEYYKILRVLQKTKQNASKFRAKYTEVKNEIQIVDQQVVDSGKLSHDAVTMKTLRQQISRAENLLMSISKREESTKFEIRQVKQDIVNLNNTIKQGVGLSAAQERTINDLIATKEQYTKEFETELEKIVSLRNGLTSLSEKIESLEQERKVIDKEIISLKEKNTAKKLEIDMEMKNKEKLERDLRELRVVVTIKSQEAVGKQGAVNRAMEDIHQIESQIKQQKALIEKLVRDQELLAQRTVKLQLDFDEQMVVTKELLSINDDALAELKVKERELASHRTEVKRVVRTRDAFLKKCRLLEEQKLQAENERKVHRSKNEALMEAIDAKRKEVELVKKNCDDLTREKDILEACLKKAVNEASRVEAFFSIQKQQESTLELEIARMKKEIAENQKRSKEYEVERNKYAQQIETLNKQATDGIFQLKEKELQIFEFKRQIIQSENKLKHQQNLYETVQSDRKLHSKQLIDSQALIVNMKKKLKIMNFQINSFKEDVNSKEALVAKETAQMVKLNKDFDLIQDEIKNLKGQNELAAAYIKTQMIEEYKLDQFVKEAEVERDRQQKALNLIITERDNLLSQLLRRNQELTTIYDKIKTQSLSMLRGEINYKEKVIKIGQVRKEITDYKVQYAYLAAETAQIPAMQKQIVQLENQIIDTETRIKALEQELENPINVHRWRKLEGSQPQVYQMILLLQTLQKQVILKNREENEKADAIATNEKLYLHLKAILAKQAGPEASQQVEEFMMTLKDKAKQLRHMDTELNMYKAQVKEYEHNIANLNERLADLKTSFVKQYMKHLRDPFRDHMRNALPRLPTKESKDGADDFGENPFDGNDSRDDRDSFLDNDEQGENEEGEEAEEVDEELVEEGDGSGEQDVAQEEINEEIEATDPEDSEQVSGQ